MTSFVDRRAFFAWETRPSWWTIDERKFIIKVFVGWSLISRGEWQNFATMTAEKAKKCLDFFAGKKARRRRKLTCVTFDFVYLKAVKSREPVIQFVDSFLRRGFVCWWSIQSQWLFSTHQWKRGVDFWNKRIRCKHGRLSTWDSFFLRNTWQSFEA